MSEKPLKLKEMEEMAARIRAMGGEKQVKKHREGGRLTARERLDKLFDPGSFNEVGLFVKHRGTGLGMANMDIPADGVITGFGTVNGRTALAFSQDFTSRAGTLGEMHAKKICKVMDLSLKIPAGHVFKKVWMP